MCLDNFARSIRFHSGKPVVLRMNSRNSQIVDVPLVSCPSVNTFGSLTRIVLLRKEVIQPHLPVRLPCYDFVPIARPTFDGSLHKG